ncbi:hypothetical protein [Rubellicoccus peritrichatus]|uniref:Ankyrin repeat protein n=1 Tax=Rubellicoccus peritrichatus TaxID=3080537 RepID=A0AAQ3LGB5_9BACT|nr:hypothetical protein [Puniceicoccus sp. CR14]WOO41629.1 hypothetical protein RZN69_00915 [Puniceicoccus sp. CR14]
MSDPFVSPLPPRPDWEQQQKRAKKLLRSYWQGAEDAVARFQALHPKAPGPTEAKLHDAQLVLARSYGFQSWAKLKQRIASLTQTPLEQFINAVKRKDIAATRQLLEKHPEVRAQINAPLFDFDSMAIHTVGGDNIEFLAMLRDFGADLNGKTQWKCGGFTLLDYANPGMLPELKKLGVELTVHAAARMNRVDELRAMLGKDPALAQLPGGDGQTPLHVAGSIEVIDLLVEHGADLEARDIDHTATPAQYLVDKPPLCQHLLQLGAKPDIFMAVALNDITLAQTCIEKDPACVSHRIGMPPWSNHEGGHIYIWRLGQATPLILARHLGYRDMESYLVAQSPKETLFLDALWEGNAPTAKRLFQSDPDKMRAIGNENRILAETVWDGRIKSVELILELGLDPHQPGVHDSTPIDRASFHGYADIIDLLLKNDTKPPLERPNEFGASPLMTCIYGAQNGWNTGRPRDHVGAAKVLLNAGAMFQPSWIPTGHEALDLLFRKHWLG